ncbi:MAG: phosphoribosyltransferase family protein [bacterium]|nr:phosphoribosyltransferase family protein [bacterium]
MRFKNRTQAGQGLAELLVRSGLPAGPGVVVGLPRGGLPVALEVSRRLGWPLDIVVARKIGAPEQPELGIGAITASGKRVLNEEALRWCLLPPGYLLHESERQRRRAQDLERQLRTALPPVSLEGKPVILVDDGIATGMTVRAALIDVLARGASERIVASPVIPPETRDMLAREADRVLALQIPRPFQAVGWFYDDFSQVSDEEAVRILASIQVPPAPERGGA